MRIPEAIICDRCKDDCSTLYVTAFFDDKQCTPAYEHHYCPECYEVLKRPIKAWMSLPEAYKEEENERS